MTSIGWDAFSDCSSLTSVTIPDSVTSIGGGAFYGCGSLTGITIPDSVTSIGYSAFSGCSSLTSITIPDSITSISDGAFCDCTGLTSVTIPNSVTSIGVSAFEDCTGLTSITIPDSVTSIGYYAFRNTQFYNNEANWENGVLYCGNYLLNAKSSVTECNIKKGTKLIADSAFSGCSSLTSVTIPDSVTSIGGAAFYGCNSLKIIVIPLSIEDIKENAFSECPNIKYVIFEGSRKYWDNEMIIHKGNDILYETEIVCDAKEKTYKFVTNCETSLPDMISYYVEKAPEIKKNNRSFAGWYDNPQLSGEPVKFPYYSDKTTLYAAWKNKNETATSTSISNNGKNIRVVPTDVETGTKITVALYNGDKFVGTKVATYRGGAIEFTTNTKYTSIKVMAWDADNLTPCAKAEVVER